MFNTGYEDVRASAQQRYEQKKKQIIKWSLTGIGIIIFLIVALNSFTRVTPGYAGVQYSLFSGLSQEVLEEGGHIHAPWVNVYEYPVSTETVNLKDTKDNKGSIQVNTGDGKSVDMDITYAFKMEPEKLPHIFKRFRRQSAEVIAESYIKQEILNTTQNLTTKNSVLQVYSQKREEIATAARDALVKSLAEDGIILEKFTFSDVRPDADTLKILQQVADAESQREVLIRQEKNLEQEANNIAQQKENEKQAAEADKEIAKINAEKKAQVTKIEAEAQAEANRLLQQSLTPELIQSEWIKKWDGKQPLLGGSGSGAIVNIPESVIGGQ